MLVKFDPEIEFEPIVDVLYAPPADEGGNPDEKMINNEIDQTKVTGVIAPLIKVNNLIISWDSVMSFELGTSHGIPYLNFVAKDFMNISKTFDQPGSDNIVRLQILPQFDNAYKKINMNFYIIDFSTPDEEILDLRCIYMAPNLWNSELKSWGKISTYKFYEDVAHYCKLGMVSNISETNDDRYIYASNTTIKDMIPTVVAEGGAEKVILDAWIDWWNNIVLCDMYDRWNAVEDNIKYWTGMRQLNIEPNGAQETEEIDRMITNAYPYKYRETYTQDYQIVNNTSRNAMDGTDKVITIYGYDELEQSDLFIEDADTKNDIFKKFIYGGEYIGDFNYIKQAYCNSAYLQKINSQMIRVSLQTPCLSLMKGEKVNFMWFDMNNFQTGLLDQVSEDVDTNIQTPPENEAVQDEFTLNKQVSGQYLIVDETLKFENSNGGPRWNLELLLSRPVDQVFNYAEAIKNLNNPKAEE